MSPDVNEPSTARPVILGSVSTPRSIRSPRGGSNRVEFRSAEERIARLDGRFSEAEAAFDTQIQLSQSIQAADPQLVLVLEALDERIDLTQVARNLDMEILVESEGSIEPTAEFALKSDNPRNPFITSCLHALCLNQQAFDDLIALWRAWKRDGVLDYGYSPLRELFAHLKDIRPWGPQDRLKMIDWEDWFANQITDHPHAVEIELWYRRSAATRAEVERNVTALVEEGGGQVIGSATIEQIGYHGLKCAVPTGMLTDLANGQFESVKVVKSANVMYLRVTSQAIPVAGEDTEESVDVHHEPPELPPVVCLLDGMPAANHPLLEGRVEILDTDDLGSESTVEERKHGTWMASVVAWGDRNSEEEPSSRRVLVRPVLTPSPETTERSEELPGHELTPDLMWRVFRELFDGDASNGNLPAAPDIAIVNLSVGDPATPFESILSSWARMIDWLSYEYGVLVVVSAGNTRRLSLVPSNTDELTELSGGDRRDAVIAAQYRDQGRRRLLAPAESINALTVGAVHADYSGVEAAGYVVDPTDGEPSISPITAVGSGYRRSIKPELAAEGGRALFRKPMVAEDFVTFTGGSAPGPGIRVASPGTNKETFTTGTSPAAALVARRAAKLHDLVDEITRGTVLTRHHRAAALKTLLVHGTGEVPTLTMQYPIEQSLGNGAITRDLSQGCAPNEAVLLFVGTIGANEEQDLILPLPDGLSARETKRIEATLSWLSPVNWAHRQYRRAALSFVKPSGTIPTLGKPRGLGADAATRGATTVQRQAWETDRAFGAGQGSDLTVRVKCYEQAGGLGGVKVAYAAAVTLWVAPSVNVDIYSQVRDQVRARVPIRPT